MLPMDRWAWSDESGREERHLETHQCPPGWTWAGEWTVDKHENTDDEGWTYAFNFTHQFYPQYHSMHFVGHITARLARREPGGR